MHYVECAEWLAARQGKAGQGEAGRGQARQGKEGARSGKTGRATGLLEILLDVSVESPDNC